jgi:hypothetical protein
MRSRFQRPENRPDNDQQNNIGTVFMMKNTVFVEFIFPKGRRPLFLHTFGQERTTYSIQI